MPEAWKQWEGEVVNGEFQLLRYLGGSEHSAVFLTRRADREPQDVAIKLIQANAENPELQLSWWELAAKLSHPHLLRLFQLGRCQLHGTELLYAVTEYAEESLAQILPYRALTPAETRDMLQSVVDALAYIHAKGFVHGHIKPTNIMAVGDQIKISVDGLCGAGESSRVLRTPGIYAAPEIADGGGMSPASDVWSLGMTLVEALTQHPPAWPEPEQVELVLPTLPEPFFDIASHCLRRNPHRRWTVTEIAAKLQQPAICTSGKRARSARTRIHEMGLRGCSCRSSAVAGNCWPEAIPPSSRPRARAFLRGRILRRATSTQAGGWRGSVRADEASDLRPIEYFACCCQAWCDQECRSQ